MPFYAITLQNMFECHCAIFKVTKIGPAHLDLREPPPMQIQN